MGKTRAAVVLFVDTDDDIFEPSDLATFVRQGLYQAGIGYDTPLPVKFQGKTLNINIVQVMDAGVAAGNGYLWTEVTPKAFRERGRYTEKEKAYLAEDILEGSYEEQMGES